MGTRRNTKKMARDSAMPDSQKRSPYGFPELERNIPTKHSIQNCIKYNIEPNQIIL